LPLAFAFAAIAGYADAIGYLRFKAFAGMMTGNTVLMGLAAFRRADLPAAEYAGVLAIFFVSACIGYALLRRFHCPPVFLLLGEAAALLLPEAMRSTWALTPLVIAMGIQNPLATRVGVPSNTTFITGDMLRFAQGVVGRLFPHPGHQPGFAIYGIAWLGYAVGAALGAAIFAVFRWPLLVPAAALAYVFWQAQRGDKLSTSGR
jgi:uncharacterized membrane protein YoaK (UPF0700 family)